MCSRLIPCSRANGRRVKFRGGVHGDPFLAGASIVEALAQSESVDEPPAADETAPEEHASGPTRGSIRLPPSKGSSQGGDLRRDMSSRAGALAGVLFALSWAGLAAYDMFFIGERGEGVTSAAWHNDHRNQLAIAVVWGAASILLLMWFLIGLAGALQRTEEGGAGALAFAAGGTAAALLLLQLAIRAMPLVADTGDALFETLTYVSTIASSALTAVTSLPLAVLVGAASLSAIRHQSIEPWVGWVGLLVAAVLIVGLLFPFGWAWLGLVAMVAVFAFPAWVLLASFGVAAKAQ